MKRHIYRIKNTLQWFKDRNDPFYAEYVQAGSVEMLRFDMSRSPITNLACDECGAPMQYHRHKNGYMSEYKCVNCKRPEDVPELGEAKKDVYFLRKLQKKRMELKEAAKARMRR